MTYTKTITNSFVSENTSFNDEQNDFKINIKKKKKFLKLSLIYKYLMFDKFNSPREGLEKNFIDQLLLNYLNVVLMK